MYLAHFNFKERPFALSTDPRFLWIGANQRQALATLRYGLEENRGLVLLGGEFGAGKTTLINAFVKELDDDVFVARLSEPGPERSDFFKDTAQAFGLQAGIEQRESLIASLTRLVDDRQGKPQRWLLIIDEAQGLSTDVMEEVLALSRLKHLGRRRFHIILVGQNELYQYIAGTSRKAFIEQVSATCKIHSLSISETAAYVDHRLNIAGAGRTPFTEDAIQAIHAFSRGVPRTINLVCDFALLHAHLEDADQVDAQMVSASKDRFQIVNLPTAPPPEESRGTDPPPPSAHALAPPRIRYRKSVGLAAALLLVFMVGGYLAYDGTRLIQLTRQAQILRQFFAPSAPPAPPQAAPSTAAALPEPDPNPPSTARPSHPPAPEASTPQPVPARPAPPDPVPTAPAASAPTPEVAESPPLPAPDTERQPAPPSSMAPADAPVASAPPPVPAEIPATFAPPVILPVPARDDVPPPRTTAIAPEAPSDTDPADIIDWLIREKKGAETVSVAPSEQSPP